MVVSRVQTSVDGGRQGEAPPGEGGRIGRGVAWGRTLLASLVAAAAAIHTVLTPDHFAEGPQFGIFFAAASVFQWWLAFALLRRPGPFVYRAGLWGSAALVATWMATRLIPPPGARAPEPVEVWGIVASSLEVAAIVALASSLPAVGPPPGKMRRRILAAAIGTGFALLVLLSSGVVTVIPPGRWSGPSFLLQPWSVGWWRFDGIWLVVGGRWSALVPWLTLAFLVPAGALVAWTVSLALRLPEAERSSARRRSVLAAAPACAVVPVCCGAPLAAFAGGAAVGVLFRFTPWLMGVSLALLAANVVLLRRRFGRRPSWPVAQAGASRDDAQGGGADAPEAGA